MENYKLYCAGIYLPAERYSPAFLDALIASGDAEYLYLAGRDWPKERCNA